MTRPVDPVGPLASVDRRKVERRDGQRRAPDASRSAVTPSSTPDADDVLSDGRAQAPVPPSPGGGVDAAAVFAAQQLGQAGQKRGLRGGPPGDLYVFLSIKQHEFFQRDGADLYCKVPISMTTAALGGQFEVGTLDGSQTRVKVPEGTQSGRQFRLKGKGMPVMRQAQMGDLYIQIAVETPQNLSKRQRELLTEFEDISAKENSPQSSGFFTRMKDFFDLGD